MATWTKVGTVRKSQKGGLYIKVDADVSLKKDSTLQLQDPRTKLDERVASGKLTVDKASELKAKIPDYISKEIYLVQE